MTRTIAVAVLLAMPFVAEAQGVTSVRVVRPSAVLDAPASESAPIGTVNPTEVLEVLDQRDDGWYLVRPPAGSLPPWRTGWVSAASVAPMPDPRVPRPDPDPSPGPQSETATANRKGFVIGLGGGAGRYTGSSTFGFSPGDGSAVVTDFKVGYAPTDQVLVFYSNQVAWMHAGLYDLAGVTGGGATFMFRPTTPSAFVTGAVGASVGVVGLGGAGDRAVDRGTGYRIGGGYEFARRWSIEGGLTTVRLDSGIDQTVLSATVNWLFY
jgi:hypothetical protein